MNLTPDDLQAIAKLLQTEVPPLVEKATEPYFGAIKQDLDDMRTSMDEFLTIVRRHEQEWLMQGIATENDLAIA